MGEVMELSPEQQELPGQRGPQQHEMRDRIVRAAEARFRHYGYGKTTVSEIAADLSVSSAYIYKFFGSKIAICEAVCGSLLGRIDEALWSEARTDRTAAQRCWGGKDASATGHAQRLELLHALGNGR